MTILFKIFKAKLLLITFILSGLLAACGDSQATSESRSSADADEVVDARETTSTEERTRYETDYDMAMGNVDAPVTVIEYASFTCSACEYFHKTVYPTLKTDYIDQDRVRYIFRQFPTPPQQLAAAGEVIARCSGDEKKYFAVVDAMFAKQSELFEILRSQGDVKQFFISIGNLAGLTEDGIDNCIKDKAAYDKLGEAVKNGISKYNIRSTPSLVINGELFAGNSNDVSEVTAAIDKLLAE